MTVSSLGIGDPGSDSLLASDSTSSRCMVPGLPTGPLRVCAGQTAPPIRRHHRLPDGPLTVAFAQVTR